MNRRTGSSWSLRQFLSHWLAIEAASVAMGRRRRGTLALLLTTLSLPPTAAFRVLEPGASFANDSFFTPYAAGFTQRTFDATLPHRQSSRVNPGLWRSETDPRQGCPAMVGPFVGGRFYCTSKAHGDCDRRSGTCFCRAGYQGVDCSQCQPAYFPMADSLGATYCYPKILCPADCSGAGVCGKAILLTLVTSHCRRLLDRSVRLLPLPHRSRLL